MESVKNKLVKNQNAFTLIEMMIVLMIISILLLIAVPNMSKSHTIVSKKSCEATMKLVQSQVAAYEMENETPLNDLKTLADGGYVDSITCPDGQSLALVNGEVVISSQASTPTP